MASHVERGRWAEHMAACFLKLRGYEYLDRNVRVGHLELDLLMRRGSLLVVVEVKYRERASHGGASGAIGLRKQRDLESAAVATCRRIGHRGSVRFDAVVVEGCGDREMRIRHFRNAFQATGRYRA